MPDNIKIIDNYVYIDTKNYTDDLLLLNDIKRTLADNNSIELKGIFVDLRQQFNICSSIVGKIAGFYKEKKVVVLLIDLNSHLDKMFSILGFKDLAKIFYDEEEYNNFIKEIINGNL